MSEAVHRIRNLPRRDWRDTPEASLAELDAFFRQPGSTEQLRTIQAVGALECIRQGGLWLNGRVGCGKTLLSIMLATLFEDKHPLIIIPGGFEEKTEREFDGYRRAWKLTHRYNITTYNALSRDEDESLLETYAPGIIICDEVDKLRRVGAGGAATANRVAHWMAKNPRTMLAGMTGTAFKDGLKDFAHVLCWGLKDGAPCPLEPGEISRWDTALRGKGSMRKVSVELGAQETLADVRKAFRSRLFATPGVIISTDQFTGVPLTIERVEFKPSCQKAIDHLTKTGERPDGWDTVDEASDESEDTDNGPGSTWAGARQLALEFYYTPDPEPPKPWAAARKAWFGFVRTQLQKGRFNTELQVRKAAIRGHFGELKAWADWEKLRPTFEPSFKPVWLGTGALERCMAWGRAPGIIWTDHRAFADRLSAETGWRWFAGGGLDESGRAIEQCNDSVVIASRQANSTGRNLQIGCGPGGRGWHRNLITAMPSNGRDFEQLLGRTHRELQEFPVEVTILEGCYAHTQDVIKVISLSEDEQEIMGRENKALTAAWL